jgi:hypothetical protein
MAEQHPGILVVIPGVLTNQKVLLFSTIIPAMELNFQCNYRIQEPQTQN